MARFVLLYFGDDARAQTFIDQTRNRVVGLYADPRAETCKCGDQPKKDSGYGPHHNYFGWQVHPRCGRAGKWWRAGYGKRLFLALGTNLLSREKTPPILQSPVGWGHESYAPRDNQSGDR